MSKEQEQPLIEKLRCIKPKKILLINPQSEVCPEHASRFPLGLFSIAGYVSNQFPAVEVKILDLQTQSPDFDLRSFIRSEQPSIVGTTAITPYIPYAHDIGKIVLEEVPDAIRMIGGYHTTVLPHEVMAEDSFDLGVLGEGEETFAELLGVMAAGNIHEIEKINGLAYREEKGNVKINNRRFASHPLDTYPFASQATQYLIGSAQYQVFGGTEKFKGQPGSICSQRGCDFNCAMCGQKKMFPHVRERSPHNVVDEIEWLYRNRNTRNFYFLDDTINCMSERISQICEEMIRRKLHIEWVAMARTDVLDQQLYNLMSRSGCVELALGVESADPNVRKAIHKGSELDDVRRITEMMRNAGILVKYYLMVGNPGETYQSAEMTARFLEEMKPDKIRVSKTIPYPGSMYHGKNDVRVLPEFQGRYEHWWGFAPPSNPSGPILGITETNLMTTEEIDNARNLLFGTHFSYNGRI